MITGLNTYNRINVAYIIYQYHTKSVSACMMIVVSPIPKREKKYSDEIVLHVNCNLYSVFSTSQHALLILFINHIDCAICGYSQKKDVQ